MKINELKPKTGNVEITANVISIDTPREFEKEGKKGKVAKAVIKDDSGECKLTLWNDEIDMIKAGLTVKVINGWADEYKGEIQITAGKYGKIEVVEKEDLAEEPVFTNKQPSLKDENEQIYSDDDEIVYDSDDDDII